MRKFIEHHIAVAVILAAVASILYVTGAHFAAVGVVVLGCLVEVVAWVVLAADPSRGSFPEAKR